MYMARQLSFSGVTFDIKEVPLSEKFIEMYNASAILVGSASFPYSDNTTEIITNWDLIVFFSFLQCSGNRRERCSIQPFI
jgi:hypothetical protein